MIDLSNIKKVPIGMYVGESDETCFASTAIETKNEIGDMVKDFVIYPGVTHDAFASKTDKEFVDRIAKMLGNQAENEFLQ